MRGSAKSEAVEMKQEVDSKNFETLNGWELVLD